MSKAIRVNSGNRSFLIETDEGISVPADMAATQAKRAEGVPEGMQPVVNVGSVQREFSEVRELIVTCCNSLFESIGALRNPKSVAIEFGIKLAGETGVPMLTKASGEANFKVSIEWKKE